MIKCVILDIDNTLLDFDKSSKKAIKLAHEMQNIPFEEVFITEFLKTTEKFWHRIEKGEIDRNFLYANRWKEVYSNLSLNYNGVETENLFRKLLFNCAELVDGAEQILKYLSKKYLICVASNAPYNQQVARLTQAGLMQYINHIFISEDIGADKPSWLFFDRCFAKLNNVKPQETIIVGDSLSADILGGKNYGLKTCWLNLKNKKISDIIVPDYTITSLLQIENIL